MLLQLIQEHLGPIDPEVLEFRTRWYSGQNWFRRWSARTTGNYWFSGATGPNRTMGPIGLTGAQGIKEMLVGRYCWS
jgi:hypothetical protein